MATEQMKTVNAVEVAKILGVTHRRLIRMILNGTLPIGVADEPEDDHGRYVVKIYENRWEAWKNARDLNGGKL